MKALEVIFGNVRLNLSTTSNNKALLIVGAGPAGLAVAGRLRKRGIAFDIVEKSRHIAASWHGHYDRLHLHTVKELSHLPHLPFPDDYPRYVSRDQLIAYCENYVQHFDIQPEFGKAVTQLHREYERWRVDFDDGSSRAYAHVVIATGANRIPNRPTWRGIKHFSGVVLHSRDYKNPAPFVGQRVVVVGMGNTGAEIALDLAENDIETLLSVRSPVAVVPRDFLGRPVQLTAKKLARLPFGLGDRIGTVVRRMAFGNLKKYGIPVSRTPPAVQLQETGKTPVIDLGTIRAIRDGRIRVVGAIERFTSSGIQLKDGEHIPCEAVILATGYKPALLEFTPTLVSELDPYGMPRQPIAQSPENKGLLFVGFDNYRLGGILGTIYDDSKTVADHLSTASRLDA